MYWFVLLIIYIIGIVFYYCLLQIAIFWLCHVLTIFFGLKFPFQARALQQTHRMKYIHITCVIIGLFLPLTPVITTMAQFSHRKSLLEARIGGYGFGIRRFPPLLCVGKHDNSVFYSLILLLSIILVVGTTFFAFIFRLMHNVRLLLKFNDYSLLHFISL